MLDSQPDLAPLIRRVRGGYLKIQGTWMPYEVSPVPVISASDSNNRLSGCIAAFTAVSLLWLISIHRFGLSRILP